MYHPAKFYSHRIRAFASVHARLSASLFTRLFFLVLSIIYSQDATTDVDAKYIKDAVLRKDVSFRVAKPKFNIYTHFLLQNRHFGARFGQYLEIIGQKPVLRVNGP